MNISPRVCELDLVKEQDIRNETEEISLLGQKHDIYTHTK